MPVLSSHSTVIGNSVESLDDEVVWLKIWLKIEKIGYLSWEKKLIYYVVDPFSIEERWMILSLGK